MRYDYTTLIQEINNLKTDREILLNINSVKIKNKYLELENKLLNSGILKDWNEINKIFGMLDTMGTSMYSHQSENLRSINKKLKECDFARYNSYIEYERGQLLMTMSSGSSWHDYFGISPKQSVEGNKIAWITKHFSGYHSWDGFENEDKEYKTKCFIIETLFETYDEFRKIQLVNISSRMNGLQKGNENILQQILSD